MEPWQTGALKKLMGTSSNAKTSSVKGKPEVLSAYGFLVGLAVVFVSALIIYSWTLSFPFIFDDEFNIVKNFGIQDPAYLWPPSGTRYVSYISFALNFFSGGMEPWGYRLVNVLIHTVNALLVYWLIVLTFKTPAARSQAYEEEPCAAPVAVALVASVIFFTHPVQTGAVTYVTQRFASLATLFYLSSLVLFIKWRLSPPTAKGYIYYFPALAFAIIAQKTKEITFTLPIVIILYDFVFLRIRNGAVDRRTPLYLIPFILTLAIIPLTVLGVFSGDGVSAFDAGTRGQQLEDIRVLSRHDYLITQFRVIVTYLRLLVLPVRQNLDYNYPLFHSLLNAEVLLSLLFILIILAAASYAFVVSRRNNDPFLLIASAGVFWFFITLSIESSVIPIKDVIFEHRLYLPSVGAFTAFSSFVFFLIGKGSGQRVMVSALVILLLTAVPLGAAAYKRNRVWRSELTLYEDVVRKSPGNARGHNNLGIAYKDLGLLDKAIEEFGTAISLIPSDSLTRLDVKADASNNLANAYYVQGRLVPAIEAYRRVLDIDPRHIEAHYNLALACEAEGCLEEAVEHLERFVEIAPPNYSSYIGDARVRILNIRARLRREAD